MAMPIISTIVAISANSIRQWYMHFASGGFTAPSASPAILPPAPASRLDLRKPTNTLFQTKLIETALKLAMEKPESTGVSNVFLRLARKNLKVFASFRYNHCRRD
jgi:hypothetical protein